MTTHQPSPEPPKPLISTDAADDPCANDPNCRDAVAELFEYLSGELTEERRSAIGKHLDDCGPCLDAYEFHGELREVISQKCRSQLPDGLRDRVLGALRALDN